MNNQTIQLVFTAPQIVGYETRDLGPLTASHVRVRTTSSGISHGTEMSAFLNKQSTLERKLGPNRYFIPKTKDDPPPYPFRYAGYEAVGVIEAVGSAVSGFSPGDRVWFPAQHMTRFVFDINDGRVQKLPPHVGDEQAVLIHLTMVALNAVLDAEVKSGDLVVVFGGGTVGQLAARIALNDGASRVFLVEPIAGRRALGVQVSGVTAIDPKPAPPIEQILAANNGRTPDVVIECSGAVAALHQAIQTSGLGGTVIAAGMYAGPAAALHLSEEFLLNRVTVKASMGVWGCPSRFPGWDLPRLLRESLRLIAEKKLNVDGFVTAKVPFEQAQRAYEMVRDEPQNHTKIMLTYGATDGHA